MRIGIRRIRSAGRDSGSIEITLPPELTALENVRCAILVRDGARPEIVLQPELTPAALIFARIWSRLHTLLAWVGDIGDFPSTEVEAVLLPPQTHPLAVGARPTLVYSYALQLGQALVPDWPVFSQDFEVVNPAKALTPVLYAPFAGAVVPLAALAGRRLGLHSHVAGLFGRIIVMLAWPGDGRHATVNGALLDRLEEDPDDQFEMQIARRLWVESCGPAALPLNPLAAQTGEQLATQAMQRIVSQLRDWQERPDRRQAARITWQQSASGWVTGSAGVSIRHIRPANNSHSEGD